MSRRLSKCQNKNSAVNGSEIYYYSAFPQAFSSILLLHFFRFKRSVTVKKTTCFRALRVRWPEGYKKRGSRTNKWILQALCLRLFAKGAKAVDTTLTPNFEIISLQHFFSLIMKTEIVLAFVTIKYQFSLLSILLPNIEYRNY